MNISFNIARNLRANFENLFYSEFSNMSHKIIQPPFRSVSVIYLTSLIGIVVLSYIFLKMNVIYENATLSLPTK